MTVQTSDFTQTQLGQAAVAVGMITHTTSHASVRSESRTGKLQRTTKTWLEATKAPKALVMATLEQLVADPVAWDAVGQRSAAFYDKQRAEEAVASVAAA